MAGIITTPDRDLGTVGTGTPGQKRKRGSDQGSPGSRRSKRGAPAATMSTNESLSANFMDSAEIASAAAAANVNVADFSALQAAANEPHPDASGDASNTAAAAAAALDYPNIHMPQPTEEQFAAPPGAESEHPGEATFTADLGHTPDGLLPHPPPPPQPTSTSVPASVPVVASSSVAQALPTMPSAVSVTPTGASSINQSQQNGYIRPPPSGPRPAVGSEEWHKIRKDNHKEVERRRRETINEGINELSKIVPNCEKNKGSILQRAVAFITQLKENEEQNIEKWTLEKLLTEQAIAELSASNDKLKQECDGLYAELEKWKQHAEAHGIGAPKKETTPATNTSSAPAAATTTTSST